MVYESKRAWVSVEGIILRSPFALDGVDNPGPVSNLVHRSTMALFDSCAFSAQGHAAIDAFFRLDRSVFLS